MKLKTGFKKLKILLGGLFILFCIVQGCMFTTTGNLYIKIENSIKIGDRDSTVNYALYINNELQRERTLGCCGNERIDFVGLKRFPGKTTVRVQLENGYSEEITTYNFIVNILTFEIYDPRFELNLNEVEDNMVRVRREFTYQILN